MPLIAWGGLSLFSQREDGSYPAWAWSMQAHDSMSALIVAAVLVGLGLISLVRSQLANQSG